MIGAKANYTFKKYVDTVKSDLYRYIGKSSYYSLLRCLYFNVGFKYSFWMRTTAFLQKRPSFYILYCLSRIMHRRYSIKYGIDAPFNTEIGTGFYIGHYGGIIINYNSIIGKNCNISAGVIIGQSNRGKRKGYPIIGDSVFIGPGAKIIGNIRVGNNVAIGANCVVTSDVPDNAVVVGIPGRVISFKGATGYINRIDY